MKRRDILKSIGLLPFGGVFFTGVIGPKLSVAAPIKTLQKKNLVEELGLRVFINAAGTYTDMTASLMTDETLEAIKATSRVFVMYGDVQDKVGERIAKICHSEGAMVTAGCWSALVLGTAAVLTGTNKKKIAALPNVDNFEKNELVLQESHSHGYTHALMTTGIKPVTVKTREELDSAINKKTALMFFLNATALEGNIKHEEWLSVAKEHGIPTIIDIAADIPPVENLWKFTDMGFDLVCISGGKGLRGPQSAGLLLGKRDLIDGARLNAPPYGGNIGRGMKVNKEEIIGMYAALDRYVSIDHNAEWRDWEKRREVIFDAISNIDGVNVEKFVPPIANHTPTLSVTWDKDKIPISVVDFRQRLRKRSPSIEVIGNNQGGFNVTVFMLQPGEDRFVARGLREEFLTVKNA